MKITLKADKEFEISNDLIKQIKERLKTLPNPEIYWDYRDHLSEEQIGKILNDPEGLNEVENEIWDMNLDYSYDMEIDHLKEALEYFKSELSEELQIEEDEINFKELAQELREEFLDYLGVDTNIKGLIGNTPNPGCRVELYSNYDCINSHWFEESAGGYDYEDTYFGAAVDALNLNPAKLKKHLDERGIATIDEFPDKPEREGQEYVDYKSFISEMENRSCGANLLTILCKVDLGDVVDHGGMPSKFIIPKGNSVGFYSSMQGGGSQFECPLIRDMVIDTKAFGETEYDHWGLNSDTRDNGYTMMNVYGVDSDFYGDEVSFLKD